MGLFELLCHNLFERREMIGYITIIINHINRAGSICYIGSCHDIFCAILYLLKEGCTWRAIPHDFPNWENVRYHYDIWSNPDENGVCVLDRVLRKLVEAERQKNGRKAQTTVI